MLNVMVLDRFKLFVIPFPSGLSKLLNGIYTPVPKWYLSIAQLMFEFQIVEWLWLRQEGEGSLVLCLHNLLRCLTGR